MGTMTSENKVRCNADPGGEDRSKTGNRRSRSALRGEKVRVRGVGKYCLGRQNGKGQSRDRTRFFAWEDRLKKKANSRVIAGKMERGETNWVIRKGPSVQGGTPWSLWGYFHRFGVTLKKTHAGEKKKRGAGSGWSICRKIPTRRLLFLL